jgi:hypothetical protein
LRKCALRFLFFCLILPLYAIQWPVEDPELLFGFGSPQGDSVSSALGLQGETDLVRSFKEGELIFSASEGYGGFGEGSGIAVLQHDDGFRSCYGSILPDKKLMYRSRLTERDVLGRAPEKLLFAIRDSRLNQWVNPFFMFSIEDDHLKPKVESVILEKDEGRIYLSQSSRVVSGSYRLLLKVSDKMYDEGEELLPNSVKVRYLGQVLFSLSLDSLSSKDGRFLFNGSDTVEGNSLFTEEGYMDVGNITINQGKGLLEVELTDYQGNRTIGAYYLNRG